VRPGTQATPKTQPTEATGLANPETYPKALDTGLTLRQQASDFQASRQRYQESRADGNSRVSSLARSTRDTFRDVVEGGQNPKDLDGRAGGLGKFNNIVKAGLGAKDLVGDKGRKAVDALTGGLVRGTPQERNQALGDLGDGVKTLAETAKAVLETARDVQKYGSAYRAASRSIQNSPANLSNQARRGMARDIAKQVFNKVDPGDVTRRAAGNRYSALHAANRASAINRTAQAQGLTNNEARDLLRQERTRGLKVADDALKQGIKAGAHSAASTLAKTAGRFAPGANIVIAAADAAKAVSTLRDPEASGAKKTTAVITAVGSALAATNIPGVSQAGAAVSAVSDFVGGFFG